MPTRSKVCENEVARIVVDAAFKVHKRLGPGLLKRLYEACLAHEINKAGYLLF